MMLRREDLNTEFKREYIDDIKLAIIAFANTDGGTLYIGVENDGTVCGVTNPDEIILQAQNAIRDAIAPDIMMFVHCSFADYDNKTIVKIEVHRGSRRPYFLKAKGIRPEGVYVRQGPSTISASYDAIRQMLIETSGGEYEKGVSFEQNLTFDTANAYFREKGVALGDAQMQTLGLVNSDKLYTNLALLLSDQCQHSIKAAVFQGNRKTIFRDRSEFSGSIFKQLEETYAYIMRHNNIRSTFCDLERIDTLDFPQEAVREGLLNAIVHRDYGSSGPILVSIFSDRLEILNQGGLLPNMSIEEVRRGVSEQRNKGLASICYRLKLIEAYGTGFDKMDFAYSGSGLICQIGVTPHSFCLTLPNRNERAIKNAEDIDTLRTHLLDLFTPTDRQRAEKIIEMCQTNGSITREAIQRKLKVSQTTAIVLLNKMVEFHILTRSREGRRMTYKLTQGRRT